MSHTQNSDRDRHSALPEPQSTVFAGLREVATVVDELMAYKDKDVLYRRAVEFCRDHLGLERCAIYVLEDNCLCGTFGTNREGQTTDERGHRLPLTAFWSENTWGTWIKRMRYLRPQDRHWVMAEVDHREWTGNKAVTIGKGWVAVTPIHAPGGGFAVLFNDAAISGAAFDETKQEIVAIFCSLLGSIAKSRPPRHLYEEVAETIKEDVMSQVYKEKIPGERALAKKYNINFKTANRAVSKLVEEGFLYRLKGKGTYVASVLDKKAASS